MGDVREIYPRNQKPVFRNQLVTLEDLEAFKNELLLSIKHLLSENKAPTIKKWLKSYQVKKILEISTGTLQNLRTNGTIPYTKIGGLIYYDADEINKILEGKKRQIKGGLVIARRKS